MNDTISRQAAAKAVDWDSEAYMAIINLPSAEKHGRWEDTIGGIYCSECGDSWSEAREIEVRGYNYCPNCGARMERSEE